VIPGHLFPADGVVVVEVAEDVQLNEERVLDEETRLLRQLRSIVGVVAVQNLAHLPANTVIIRRLTDASSHNVLIKRIRFHSSLVSVRRLFLYSSVDHGGHPRMSIKFFRSYY